MAKRGVEKENIRLTKKQSDPGEVRLQKKKEELSAAKAKYQKLAKEFIDLWVRLKRERRGA
jgi:hypothetical protein